MDNQKKEQISKILIKEYLNIEQNSKGLNFKKKKIQSKKKNYTDSFIIKKMMMHNLEKTNLGNKISNVMTNTKNSNKNCKLKQKENKEKLGKKEEENMILKMNKSNNLNSLIEEYQI